MPSPQVVFTVDAKHAGAIQKFLEVSRAADGIGDALKKAGQEAGAADGRLSDMLKNAGTGMTKNLANFVGFGSALAGIFTTVKLIGDEYERMKEVRGFAHEKFSGYAVAREAAQNAFFDTPLDKHQKQVDRIVQKYGADDAGVSAMQLLEHVGSARGSVKPQDALNVAETVAEATGQLKNPEFTNYLAGAILDLQNADIDAGRKPTDARALIGQAYGANQSLRTVNPADFALNNMRGIANYVSSRNTPFKEAVGIAGALGSSIPDVHGRLTSNAMTKLGDNLDDTMYDLMSKGWINDPKLRDRWEKKMTVGQKAEYARGRGTESQKYLGAALLGHYAESQELRDLAMGMKVEGGKMAGEAVSEKAMRAFVTPGHHMAQKAKYLESQVPDEAGGLKYYDKVTSGSGLSEAGQFAARERAMRGLLAVKQSHNHELASQGGWIQFMEEMRKTEGKGAMGTKIGNFITAMQTSSMSQEQIGMQGAGLADEMANHVIGKVGGHRLDRKLHDWAEKNDPENVAWNGTYKGDQQAFERYRAETMTGEERTKIDSIRHFKKQMRGLLERSGSKELPSDDDTGGFGDDGQGSAWEKSFDAVERRSALQKELADKVSENTQAVRDLADKLAGGLQFDVRINDQGGRPLSRIRSQSRPAGLLFDEEIG